MASATSGVANGVTADDVEVKIEYPDIDVEEDNASDFNPHISIEPIRRIPGQTIIHQDAVYNLWTSKATSCLISQYKKYRSMVGQSTQFRSLRDMFDIISVEMQKNGFYFSPQKCENKWRVLERKYKNLVMREMMKKPGRIKHYGHWEHKKALDEIFNEKRKSVYLTESEYPPVGNSTKYALILPKPINASTQAAANANEKSKTDTEEAKRMANIEASDPLAIPPSVATTEHVVVESPKRKTGAPALEKLLEDLKRQLEESEKNKEKRHLEKMELRQKELKVQERLLKIKEQKLELQKQKILAVAQSLKLNLL